jgi:phenylalanyl-tRNA synthetase alpha chain
MAYTVPKLTDHSPAALEKAAGECIAACTTEAAEVRSDADLKAFRDRWMARKNGILTQINDQWLKGAPKDAKREAGMRVNELKMRITELVEAAHVGGSVDALASESVDISLPGIRRPIGAEHPVIKTRNEIVSVFEKLGYSVAEGPVVETDYYNFEALNFPPNHPARDTQDTLFIAGQQSKPQRERLLLRTHTSPVQIRTMEKMRPPLRIVIPGTVHRNDPPDASHSPMFHQIEGLAVDTGITFCDFKGTVEYFVREFLGPKVKTRLRPSYFPFTEPSVEVDATCVFCGGKGCNVCKQSGWIELFGAGMVDPAVYGFVNYDAKKFTGFAFGLGVERLTQLKYNINDLQLYFQNDVRFLRQFA